MIFIYIVIAMLIGCGSNENSASAERKDTSSEDDNTKAKYRTYKNQVPMMNTNRKKLERLSDIEDARRNIMKTYDSYKPKIAPSSGE